MMGFLTAVVVAGSALIGLIILGAILLMGLRLLRPKSGAAASGFDRNEAQLMQELYQGLEKLDARIENLESILLHKDGKGGQS
ncbi:MAG TPA: envelope stress response membrane protein PspB [Desulfonatronum sp.]|nr:envelope stress response membrane protein PspB [Desulfonatronum sp.]